MGNATLLSILLEGDYRKAGYFYEAAYGFPRSRWPELQSTSLCPAVKSQSKWCVMCSFLPARQALEAPPPDGECYAALPISLSILLDKATTAKPAISMKLPTDFRARAGQNCNLLPYAQRITSTSRKRFQSVQKPPGSNFLSLPEGLFGKVRSLIAAQCSTSEVRVPGQHIQDMNQRTALLKTGALFDPSSFTNESAMRLVSRELKYSSWMKSNTYSIAHLRAMMFDQQQRFPRTGGLQREATDTVEDEDQDQDLHDPDDGAHNCPSIYDFAHMFDGHWDDDLDSKTLRRIQSTLPCSSERENVPIHRILNPGFMEFLEQLVATRAEYKQSAQYRRLKTWKLAWIICLICAAHDPRKQFLQVLGGYLAFAGGMRVHAWTMLVKSGLSIGYQKLHYIKVVLSRMWRPFEKLDMRCFLTTSFDNLNWLFQFASKVHSGGSQAVRALGVLTA